MSEREKDLEAVLLEYVERYGLTSKARRHLGSRDLPEADGSDVWEDQSRTDGALIRDTLIVLREKARTQGCLASHDALRIAIMRVCLEHDIPTTLSISDLVHGFRVMVPQSIAGDKPKSH